ncbi:hypothetical protein [Fructilactobacillus florum]|uniref:hypothetical protein n=1 Tax=Fructilactobacillus florum TaxID=640331 RepID=UPI0006CFE5F6|nr:hypothetical protein [Fructilactobacillus florum]
MAIPENMEEINQELGRQAAAGNQITERTLILQTVQQLLQQYLIAAEEGFYDTVTLADDRTLIFFKCDRKTVGDVSGSWH